MTARAIGLKALKVALRVVAVAACLCSYYFTLGIILVLPADSFLEQVRDAVLFLTISGLVTWLTILLFWKKR